MLRLRFRRILLLTFIHSVILVLAEGPNWKKMILTDVDILETGDELGKNTYFEVVEDNDQIKAVGNINLTKNVDPQTTVKWKALYLNPDDNQYKVQAESEKTGLCDFLVFQAPVAQMFFKDSNMTACPFAKGWYFFPGSGPIKDAFPQVIPEGRDDWKVEVISETMSGRKVAHLMIGARLER